MMRIAVLVGNPKAKSRTLDAAILVARKLSGEQPHLVVDLADLGSGLLEWGNETVTRSIEAVQKADLLVVASPTYKATYTGLLKLFLDQIPSGGLKGIISFPLMLGAGPAHALAPELLLRPVLVELGAVCPAAGLYLIDKTYDQDPRLDEWVATNRRFLSWNSAASNGQV
jgi:FMN reductase